MDEHRTQRVSVAVREEITELISFELDDPRLADIEVTDAQVTPDGRHARVRIGVRGAAPRKQEEAIAALNHAANYLRHELAVRLSLRHVPELHFDLDKNPDVESRIDFLLRRARRSRSSG